MWKQYRFANKWKIGVSRVLPVKNICTTEGRKPFLAGRFLLRANFLLAYRLRIVATPEAATGLSERSERGKRLERLRGMAESLTGREADGNRQRKIFLEFRLKFL